METQRQNQAKTPSTSPVAPVQTGLFHSRPFHDSEQEAAEALPSSHQSPDLQTQIDTAARFGHNFSRVQVQSNTPTVIQPQSLVAQPEEQQDERETDGMSEPVKLMASPVLGKPIQREAGDDEPLQMRPQLGFLTPVIQREADEGEPIQMMPQGGWLQRLPQEADEEPIQMKPQLGLIRRQEAEDEEPIQMKPQFGLIQRQESEADEEPIQMQRIQLKVVVGQPGDKYEQEADSVAAQVMSMSVPPTNSMPIQRQGEEEEQEPLVQRSSLTDSITPLVQRLPEEQEEPLQAKSLLQRAGNGNALAGSNVESQLNSSKGGGSPLPDEVRSFMEPRFGANFSAVRVHTGGEAVQMNRELGAQAFTHGSNIYFGEGKSPENNELTAHELTHVVQQAKPQTAENIQRQDREETTTQQPHVPFIFGDLTTYDQLAAAARFGIAQVQDDLRDVPPDNPIHARASEWIGGLRGWLPYLQRQGTAPLTAAAADQAQLHLDEGIAIRTEIANFHRAVVQREMDRVAERARAAAREAERLQPHLRNSLRAAYRSGDSSVISDVANMIGTVTDIGMGFHELARQSAEVVASVQGINIPAVGRYVQAIDKLNRGLALFNLAFSLIQTEATTQFEEGMRQISVAAGAFSSLGTVVGLPAHMGLYANLYLVPLTNAIMAQISRLTVVFQQENDLWVEAFGEPLRYGAEPGGQPMWQFMVSVMRAASAAEVPPISTDVAEYLFEHRDALEAGAREEVPTEGWWFWRELETERARQWIFRKRDLVWAMFYGRRAVPR
jgi:hypothetical protein